MLQQRVQMIQIINIFVGLFSTAKKKKILWIEMKQIFKSVINIYWLILMTMKLIENLI